MGLRSYTRNSGNGSRWSLEGALEEVVGGSEHGAGEDNMQSKQKHRGNEVSRGALVEFVPYLFALFIVFCYYSRRTVLFG